MKVATVEVESSVDNMATLPVSRAQQHQYQEAEKNNAANKEMELRKVQPKPDKRYCLYPAKNKGCSRTHSQMLFTFCFGGKC